MEKFLDNQAEPTHDDMKKRLKLHDEQITSYHAVCLSKNLQQENNTSELLASLLWKQTKNGPPCSRRTGTILLLQFLNIMCSYDRFGFASNWQVLKALLIITVFMCTCNLMGCFCEAQVCMYVYYKDPSKFTSHHIENSKHP